MKGRRRSSRSSRSSSRTRRAELRRTILTQFTLGHYQSTQSTVSFPKSAHSTDRCYNPATSALYTSSSYSNWTLDDVQNSRSRTISPARCFDQTLTAFVCRSEDFVLACPHSPSVDFPEPVLTVHVFDHTIERCFRHLLRVIFNVHVCAVHITCPH